MRTTLGPRSTSLPSPGADLTPGILYRESCPPAGYLRVYAVDMDGVRCFEVCVRAIDATPALIARWSDDAQQIACPVLALVRQDAAPSLGQPQLPQRRR